MAKLTLNNESIFFQRKDEILRIDAYGPDCIRVRSTRNAVISDEAWTLMPPTDAQFEIIGDEKKATLTNGDIRVEIIVREGWYSTVIHFYKGDKKILSTTEEGDYVNRYKHVSGDMYQVKAIFESNPSEHFYGLGQEQQDYFDRKGCCVELAHWNTKSTIPVLYSSLGYGFIWNNPAPGRCEATNNHTLWCANEAYQIDYLVFGGKTPADLAKRYCKLTGYSPCIPDWALGFWQCKLRYESQEDLLEVAREYKKRGIPIDAIVIDYFHWTEQGDWKFDPKYWPDPKAMCDELEELGIHPVVSVWPTINPDSENYAEMSEGNMLIRTENGQFGTFNFYGQQTFIDATNPTTREFVWDKLKKNYYDYGIKTFWLDEAEPEVHPQQFNNLHFYAGNGAQTALLYPFYYSKMLYDGLKKEGEEEVIGLTRAAYIGSQRFGMAVWNGDIPSTFKALKQSIVSGLSMSLCGIPWWNSDIGGFHSGDIESDYFRELIVRWFQFGVFSPIMRLHGARKKTKNQIDRHPGVKETSGGDNEIWSFGEKNYPILKSLIELRERLRPYLRDLMVENSKTGAPIMRPMFYHFSDDEVCYTLDDQYMFGADILFAPIYEQGCTSRRVYLPKGEWILTKDGTKYEGAQWIEVEAKIDEFIAFVTPESGLLDFFINR